MVEIAEIKDKDSLEVWLNFQPQEVSLAIAARSVLRAVPFYWQTSLKSTERRPYVTVLPILRSCFISAVAATTPTLEISEAARAAARADSLIIVPAVNAAARAAANTAPAPLAASATALAARAAANVAPMAASTATNGTPFDVEALLTRAEADFWDVVREDCAAFLRGANLIHQPLWPEGNPLERTWADLKPRILAANNWQPGGWRFWVDWYEQMLDPTTNPPDWALLEQIALIKPEVWEEGPEAVGEEIKAIELAFAERSTTTGEQFAYDAEAELFRRNPVASSDAPVLKYCVDRLSELSELAKTMGNMQGMLGAELFFVRRAVENHAENPLMVWDNCGTALNMLQGNLASGVIPSDEAFVPVLQATLTDVRKRLENDPAVQYVAPHRPKTAPIDNAVAVDAMVGAAEEVAQVVEPEVAAELREDVRTLRDRFAASGMRTAAFLTSAGRILGVFLAACAKGTVTGLDWTGEVTKRVKTISGDCFGIVTNLAKIGAVGGTPLAAVAHSDKIPAALNYIVQLFP